MSAAVLRPAAFRHVVFPELARSKPPFNFATGAVVEGAALAATPAVTEEQVFLRWVFEQGGLDLADYKLETLRRRIPSCLRALRVRHLWEARHLLQRNSSALKTALNALVIGVTSFFRDPAIFSALGQRVLPELTSRGSAARIWSAGCSQGAELYSVAMLLAELGGLHRCYLLGTDCVGHSVKRAAQGIYDAQDVKTIPRQLADRYFTRDCDLWRIHSWLRTVVQWRTANVLCVLEPGAWDMILCRNLAIYLRASAAARLWQSLHDSLRPGGILVLGKAERPMGVEGLSMIAPCIYRRNRS
jgi:chemotaxis protein methyltransferase CheR